MWNRTRFIEALVALFYWLVERLTSAVRPKGGRMSRSSRAKSLREKNLRRSNLSYDSRLDETGALRNLKGLRGLHATDHSTDILVSDVVTKVIAYAFAYLAFCTGTFFLVISAPYIAVGFKVVWKVLS
jgi:hypothetical protein